MVCTFSLHSFCAPIVCREYRAFKNTARSDGLELQHWVKAAAEPAPGMSVHFGGVMGLTCCRLSFCEI